MLTVDPSGTDDKISAAFFVSVLFSLGLLFTFAADFPNRFPFHA